MTWTCPECGARFVTRNLSHSCIRRTVDEFFADKPAAGVAHAQAFIAEARKLGPVTLHAVKTRIALMVDVRFAAINRIGADLMKGHLWLKARYRSERFDRIESLGRDYIYHFEISDRRPIDDELRSFLSLSYAIGRREHIVPKKRSGRMKRWDQMSKLNATWHEKHPMPKNATLEQRVSWHVRHAKACGCREIPRTIAREMKTRGIRIPRRAGS